MSAKMFSSYVFFRYADTIYKVTSKLNHSCLPNLVYVNSPSFHISWIAGRDIDTGEMLTINYSEELFLEPTLVRRRLLLDRYEFVCECRRCTDPTELGTYYDCLPCFKCTIDKKPIEDSGYLVRVTPDAEANLKCDKCGNIYIGSKVNIVVNKLETIIHASRKDPCYYEELRVCVVGLLSDRTLHLHHTLVFKASVDMMGGIMRQLKLNWKLLTPHFCKTFLPFANSVHHIFTTFVPTRQEYRGTFVCFDSKS